MSSRRAWLIAWLGGPLIGIANGTLREAWLVLTIAFEFGFGRGVAHTSCACRCGKAAMP